MSVKAGIMEQMEFRPSAATFPEGFRYRRDIITAGAEQQLLAEIRGLPFKGFEFHGHVGNRRTVSFGFSYDFDHERLTFRHNGRDERLTDVAGNVISKALA